MRNLFLVLAALFISACASIAPPAQSIATPPDGGTLNRQYHNAPITLTGFVDDRIIRLPLGGSMDPIDGTVPEYYWITNAGDPTTKPKLTFTATSAGFLFIDTANGSSSPSVILNWGSTVVISQESPSSKSAMVTRYENPGAPAIANAATAGSVLSGGDIAVDTTGLVRLDPLANPTIAGTTILSTQPVPFKVARSTATSQTAPTVLDSNSVYAQLGEGEFGLNSYRLIGFGFRSGGNNSPPAFIGYQETSATGATAGDIIIGGRPSNVVTAPLAVNLRVRIDGQIIAGPNYVPSGSQSLATRKYLFDTLDEYVPVVGMRSVTIDGSATLKIPNTVVFLKGTVANLTIAANVATTNSPGVMQMGGAFDLVSTLLSPVTVTFTDKVSIGADADVKTIIVKPQENWRCAWNGADGWRCWAYR